MSIQHMIECIIDIVLFFHISNHDDDDRKYNREGINSSAFKISNGLILVHTFGICSIAVV